MSCEARNSRRPLGVVIATRRTGFAGVRASMSQAPTAHLRGRDSRSSIDAVAQRLSQNLAWRIRDSPHQQFQFVAERGRETASEVCRVTNEPLLSGEIQSSRYRTNRSSPARKRHAMKMPSLRRHPWGGRCGRRARLKRRRGSHASREFLRKGCLVTALAQFDRFFLVPGDLPLLTRTKTPLSNLAAMESLSETNWDVLIAGTGVEQSLLALYVCPRPSRPFKLCKF